jgi:hypothetical protein
MMIVNAARSFRGAFIGYFLFTLVNSHYGIVIHFNPSIPTEFAPFYPKNTELGALPRSIYRKYPTRE